MAVHPSFFAQNERKSEQQLRQNDVTCSAIVASIGTPPPLPHLPGI